MKYQGQPIYLAETDQKLIKKAAEVRGLSTDEFITQSIRAMAYTTLKHHAMKLAADILNTYDD